MEHTHDTKVQIDKAIEKLSFVAMFHHALAEVTNPSIAQGFNLTVLSIINDLKQITP